VAGRRGSAPSRRRRGAFPEGEAWSREKGYAEIASDARIENAVSLAAHRALGSEEIERVVCFAKAL
jgi:aminoglycoside 6'-N-acetyltransferase I